MQRSTLFHKIQEIYRNLQTQTSLIQPIVAEPLGTQFQVSCNIHSFRNKNSQRH
jgi:hypothetical protein